MKGFGKKDKPKKKEEKNKIYKQSREEVINQAIKFHLEGKISLATKCYQSCLRKGFKDHRIFSNYGVILKDLGKLEEAEISQRKAIQLKPDLTESHSNLGIILRDLGKLQEAEFSTRKAIEINPNFANAHSNLGIILRDVGKLKEAEFSTRKAIEINPNFAKAHSNLGILLRDLGKLKEAEFSTRKAIEINPNFANDYSNLGNILSDLGRNQEALDAYLKAIEINPRLSNIYSSISDFLKDTDALKLNKSKLKNILYLLFDRDDINHQGLFNSFNFVFKIELLSHIELLDYDFLKNELLFNNKLMINALKKMIFQDINWEKLLTKLRENISRKITKDIELISGSELQFIYALAEQCFLNEYNYSSTKEENISINTIINRCRDGEINEIDIAILACYFPLYKLLNRIPALKSINSLQNNLKGLIKLQLIEPLKEIELSQKIKSIGPIKDNVSKKVKSQYEYNPYPRWIYGNPSKELKVSAIQVINSEIKPNSIHSKLKSSELKILIAGCGTGHQILHAQRYQNSHIKAIDLSSASLAYSQRKIDDLGINNVELIQMDILEVSLLEEQFDIIECGGVLHHMSDPKKGLKSLLSVCKNHGFLKLGLYSELARKDIVKAREYISSKNLHPTQEDIRNFRQDIISGELIELNLLTSSSDFYTLSSCRDLCFHFQEHRFTITQLEEIFNDNHLNFLGFFLPPTIKSLYEEYFPEDKKQTNLQNWTRFEEKYPNTFSAMYQFWVSKMSN